LKRKKAQSADPWNSKYTVLIITGNENEKGSAYHIQDAPDPGPAGLPDPDGGVDDLDGDERSGDGADARAAEEAALGGQADEPAGDGAQEQAGCTGSINLAFARKEKKRKERAYCTYRWRR
jgi:hypothetical protein